MSAAGFEATLVEILSEVADARQKEVHDLVFWYDELRDPEDLKRRMEAVRDKISEHRRFWGRLLRPSCLEQPS
jgi:hypothetical protein